MQFAASSAMPVKPSSVQEASSSGTSSPFNEVMAKAVAPAVSQAPVETSSKKEAGPEQKAAPASGQTPVETSSKKEADPGQTSAKTVSPSQAPAQAAAQGEVQAAIQGAVQSAVQAPAQEASLSSTGTSSKKEAITDQKSGSKSTEKKTADKDAAAAGAVDAVKTDTRTTPAATGPVVTGPEVTAPAAVLPPALAVGFTKLFDESTVVVAKGDATDDGVTFKGKAFSTPKDAATAEADKSVDAVVDGSDLDPASAASVSGSGNPAVQEADQQAVLQAVQAITKNDVAMAEPFEVPVIVPMTKAQAAAASAAAAPTKLSALAAADGKHGTETVSDAALPAGSPFPSVPGATPELQAFSGIGQPAAAGLKAAGLPMTKMANGIAPSRDSIGKPKDAEVVATGNTTAAITAAGGADKNNGGASSTGGSSNFQDSAKTMAPDVVRETASAVGAIDGGGAANTSNEGGQPAMEQMVLAGDAHASQTGHEAGNLFQAASTAAAAATSAAHGNATAAMPALSSAQLLQSMRGSEMRIGMHSEEFGKISIHTSLTHKTLAAQISFDHAELGKALAVHVPAMQEKLGMVYGVQTRVEVRDGQTSFSGEAGQQGGGQFTGSQQRGQNAPMAAAYKTGIAVADDAAVSQPAMYDSSTRLDIRI